MRERYVHRAFAAGVLVACFMFTGSNGALAIEIYTSNVGLKGTSVQTDDNLFVDVGAVGKPFQTSISYGIGTYTGDPGVPMTQETNAVPNPEYLYFCPNDEACDLGGALGLVFDSVSGTISGTPTKTGVFFLFPAVRDKDNGENAYNGDGAWFTTYTTSGGKTWIEAKQKSGILILPVPGPKARRADLQCTFSNANIPPLLLTLDFDTDYVEVLGRDGNLAGIYRINNPDADVIGWSALPSSVGFVSTGGVSINRTTGTLMATNEMTATNLTPGPMNAHCEKRSTARAF